MATLAPPTTSGRMRERTLLLGCWIAWLALVVVGAFGMWVGSLGLMAFCKLLLGPVGLGLVLVSLGVGLSMLRGRWTLPSRRALAYAFLRAAGSVLVMVLGLLAGSWSLWLFLTPWGVA